LASCAPIPWEDISSTPEYSSVIGKQFKTKKELWAFGITVDRNYKKQVDYIDLMEVRISGPEVVTREKLNSGFTFRVVKILKAKSFLVSRMAYTVEAIDSNKFKDYVVEVRLTGDINNRNYGLDESIYALENNVR
jgi:hypothetical protein